MEVLDNIAEELDKEGFHQTEMWEFDGEGYSTVLKNDNGEELPIRVDIEITEEDLEEIKKKMLDSIDLGEMEDKIRNKITKLFKKDGYKQNNEWEYIPEDDVYWTSFINFNLDGCVVTMFPLKKEDLKK